MMHTERDLEGFEHLMLLLLGTSITALYAVAVVVALVLKAFRFRRALYTSFVLSAIASIPFLWVLVRNPTADVLSLPYAVLLCFVWAAPTVEYRLMRQKAHGTGPGGPR